MTRIMMIEDDPDITRLLTDYLVQYGFELTGFSDPKAALNSLEMDHYDLIILDLSLPHMDGLDVCRHIVAKYPIPIIISTARSSLGDKVIGLELGADDYLPKPYDPRELVARIHSVLRRQKGSTARQEGEFHVDSERMVILKNDTPLKLTQAEYEILKLMIEKRGFVISREFIANNVDVIRWESSDRSIDVIVSRIRQKIGDDSKNPRYIKAIRGAGYKFLG